MNKARVLLVDDEREFAATLTERLGLFVSHGIMKKLGGRILVESVVAVGTNFTLELPVRHIAQEISGE